MCLDTCHLFAAGEYNISDVSEVDRFREDFDSMIGWNRIKIWHLNDSKLEFGSRRDRHEDLDFGKIGKDGLKRVIKYAVEAKQPLIMETPLTHIKRDECMKIVKGWIDEC